MTSRADSERANSEVARRPDPTRVLGLFVPGHAFAGEGEGRASRVVAHVLGLSDAEVCSRSPTSRCDSLGTADPRITFATLTVTGVLDALTVPPQK